MIIAKLALIFLSFAIIIGCNNKNDQKRNTTSEPIHISMTIDFEGEQKLIEVKNLELPAESSIRDAILEAKNKSLLDFKDTLYTGMGHLLLSINNAEASGAEFWFYCVNGRKANKGIDDFELNDGDIVKWALTEKSDPCN